MHKHELYFQKTENIDGKPSMKYILRSMNALCLFSWKFHSETLVNQNYKKNVF